jgi:hypothetical protein
MRVINGIPLGSTLLLPVGTVNSVQTLKGFETLSHPHLGDISTHQSQPYFCYAPGRFSTLHYVAAAAQAARLLAPFDKERATAIAESARRAFAWAEANTDVPPLPSADVTKRYTTQISDLRGRSAMQLLLLDGASVDVAASVTPSTVLQMIVSAEERCTTGQLVGSYTENGLLLAWHVARPDSVAVLGETLAATLQPACRNALAGIGGIVTQSIATTSFRVPLAFMPETRCVGAMGQHPLP